MATLDEVIADMAEETTLISGVKTLISGLKQQLSDALSGVTLPPDTAAKIDAIFAAAEANKAALSDALTVNTPVSEIPPAPAVQTDPTTPAA